MPQWAAIASTVSNVAGDAISAVGQQNMNLANREWSAQQAAINRQFQVQQTQEAQQYATQMSDTAMSRRMADLRGAGVNPMLAVTGGLGSASSPTIAPQSGSMAASPNTANPLSSFNNIGGVPQQISQLQLTNAQTAKTRSETPTPQYVTVDTEPDGSQSITVNANAGHELGDQQLANMKGALNEINSTINKNSSTITLQDAQTRLQGLNADQLQEVMAGVIKAQNAQNALDTTLAQSGEKVLSTSVMGQNLGTWIEALRMVIGASKGH